MAKSAYQLWQEDQKKKEQERANGQVRFKEESAKSRLQYSDTTYQGNSEKGNYKWETDILKDVKMPKGMAKNYNSKFDYLTSQMGMSSAQAQDFRKYMDFQEDKDKDKYAKKKYNFKLDKEGNLVEDEEGQWKLDRSSYSDGSALRLKSDDIDTILENMTNKSVQRLQTANQIQEEKAEKADLITTTTKKRQKERDGLLGFLDRTLGRASYAAHRVFGDDFVKAEQENYRELALSQLEKNPNDKRAIAHLQQLNAADREAQGGVEKTSDFIGRSLGEIAPYTVGGAYGAANAILGKLGLNAIKTPLARDAVRGMTAGAVVGAGKSVVRDNVAENPNDFTAADYAKTIGLESLFSGAADAGIGAFARNINLKGQAQNLSAEAQNYFKNQMGLPTGSTPFNVMANPLKGVDAFYDNPIKPPAPKAAESIAVEPAQKAPSILDELLYAQRGNGPKARGAVEPIKNPARYAKEDLGRLADDILKGENGVVPEGGFNQRLLDVQKDMQVRMDRLDSYGKTMTPEDAYLKVRKETDPATFDDLISQAAKEADKQAYDSSLEGLLRNDPKVAEAVRKLNGLSGSRKNPPLKTPDEIIAELQGKVSPSKAAEAKVAESVVPVQESRILAPSKNEPSIPMKEVNEPKGKEPLLKLNLQRFHTGTGVADVKLFNTEGAVKSEKAITSTVDKYYEGYINSNHSAKVAEKKVLEKAIAQATKDGKPKKAAQLQEQLKALKRSGSDFEKSISNEKASGVAAKATLTKHFKNLDGIIKSDEEMAEALTYQVAKDLLWRRKNGNPDYVVNKDIDWGQLNDIANRGDANPKFKEFTDGIRSLTQEWRDVMLQYGLISKESYAALSENPFYMPLARDLSHSMDNIDRGTAGKNISNTRASGPAIVHTMKQGDLDSFYKNPVETLINNTFSVYKNAYKEETGRQALRLANLDKDGLFFKEISKNGFEKGGGIKLANSGKPKYVRVQDDLMDMIKENDESLDMDVLGKLTSAFAGLKTRSLEYQATAAPRDLATSFMNSQITNPIRYAKEAMVSIKNGNKDVKEIGGYFDKAYNDHMAGIDPAKVMNEFKKQYSGNVTTYSPTSKEGLKGIAKTIGKYLDIPFKPAKWLGRVTDDLPRDIEARETKRLFMEKNGEKIGRIQAKLDEVNNQLKTPDPKTSDKLEGQKEKLENMLNRFQQDLRREQLYRSRDVINYQRTGRGGVAKKIRQWAIFANTTTQSKDRLVRAFIERPAATLFKAALATSPFITAQKIMYDNLNDTDKMTYDGLPNYLKQMNYVFIHNGNVVTVPKIQEMAILSTPVEAALTNEDLDDSMRLATKEIVPYQAGNFAQGLFPEEGTLPSQNMQVPSFVGSPLIDVITNKKAGFNQKPVSYGALAKDAANKEANEYTLDIFKKLMGNNPTADQAEYLIKQYFGDAGKYGSYTADVLADPTNKEKIDEALRNLNPLQDRYYHNDNRFFKKVPQ